MHDGVDLREVVANELVQRRESGYNLSGLEAAVEAALADGSVPLVELLDRLEQAPRSAPPRSRSCSPAGSRRWS
jgi:hypothetical protein